MTKFYMNKETGELLNREEMWEQFCNDYDGNDPTNIDYLNYDLYFISTHTPLARRDDKRYGGLENLGNFYSHASCEA